MPSLRLYDDASIDLMRSLGISDEAIPSIRRLVLTVQPGSFPVLYVTRIAAIGGGRRIVESYDLVRRPSATTEEVG